MSNRAGQSSPALLPRAERQMAQTPQCLATSQVVNSDHDPYSDFKVGISLEAETTWRD